MGTFTQKPKATQQITPYTPMVLNRSHFKQGRETSTVPDLQRKADNQSVQGLRQADPNTFETSHFVRDFSRIPSSEITRSSIRPKLTITDPGDLHEQQADHVADQVMHMPDQAGACGDQSSMHQRAAHVHNHERLQSKTVGRNVGGQIVAPDIVHDVLRSPGEALDSTVRLFMESRFGYDFSQVRVHKDKEAAEASRAVNALAFTVGQNVVFGASQYAPQTTSGRRLIAHELAHVMQNHGENGGQGSSVRTDTLARYGLEDCDAIDHRTIRNADAKATRMAGKALGGLREWAENDPGQNPNGIQDQSVTDLLINNFGFAAPGPLLEEVIDGYKRIEAEFTADDYDYECEDDCDDAHAYVYAFWTDLHLCMNKLRGKSETFIAGVMLHEMSHYVAATDDVEYFYYGAPATTSLHPVYAVNNADSYEGFAAEYYKLG